MKLVVLLIATFAAAVNASALLFPVGYSYKQEVRNYDSYTKEKRINNFGYSSLPYYGKYAYNKDVNPYYGSYDLEKEEYPYYAYGSSYYGYGNPIYGYGSPYYNNFPYYGYRYEKSYYY